MNEAFTIDIKVGDPILIYVYRPFNDIYQSRLRYFFQLPSETHNQVPTAIRMNLYPSLRGDIIAKSSKPPEVRWPGFEDDEPMLLLNQLTAENRPWDHVFRDRDVRLEVTPVTFQHPGTQVGYTRLQLNSVTVLTKVNEEVEPDLEEGFFRNYYFCAPCDHDWEDVWSSQCDDKCKKCGNSYSPHYSEDA